MEQKASLNSEIIRCDKISKSFISPEGGEFLVIDNISFNVHENEFLVLFGPGQCGKTTLINILSGIIPPTSGLVEMNGQPVLAPDASRGVIYQTTALFPWRTVRGNVMFGPSVRGCKRGECLERAQHYIDLVGLTGFENHFPVQLSGGMQQRVGIARAYCNNPQVLLMDEPFGHLDAQTRYKMENDIESIWQKEKRTVVFVTNNIEEAIYLADRIILFSDCPSTIKAEYKIDLPRSRNYMDPAFIKLRQEIMAVAEVAA